MFFKNIILSFIFIFLFGIICVQAKDLELVEGKVYLLNFDEEIQNIHFDNQATDVQIMHTIFDDKKQIILALKSPNTSILQIKTNNNLYNYKLLKGTTSSKELIEIDYPPIENLQVDIFGGS